MFWPARFISAFLLILAGISATYAFLSSHTPSASIPTVGSIAATPSNAASSTYEMYPVVHVVDGDTIDVSKGGKKVRVRLIGIDTPEVVDPRKSVQCFGEEASKEMHTLVEGESVRLEPDPSQDTYDKYGRLLAYVFLHDGTNVNEYLIANGYGHEYTYRLPYKYQTEFKAAEKEAREAERGLWAPSACANP